MHRYSLVGGDIVERMVSGSIEVGRDNNTLVIIDRSLGSRSDHHLTGGLALLMNLQQNIHQINIIRILSVHTTTKDASSRRDDDHSHMNEV